MSPPTRPYPLYTDRASIESVLSEAGVRLRLDFDGDGQVNTAECATALTNVIQAASDTVDFYTWSKYDPNLLATSSLVWRWASVLGAYELDRLRNNPASETLATWAEEITEKLEAVQERGKIVPGVPMRMTCAPTYTNWRVNPAYQFRVIRIERGRSSPSKLPDVPDYQELYSQMEL